MIDGDFRMFWSAMTSAVFTKNLYAHLLKGQQRVAAEALDHQLA